MQTFQWMNKQWKNCVTLSLLNQKKWLYTERETICKYLSATTFWQIIIWNDLSKVNTEQERDRKNERKRSFFYVPGLKCALAIRIINVQRFFFRCTYMKWMAELQWIVLRYTCMLINVSAIYSKISHILPAICH